ncbi:ABC transporter permease [Borrelia miyamotoi]|uniref:ABC transporter permease n=1 Tax=Borrelia miyamotoi TaxID=47466 RepID=A0AAQ2X0B3_9SPIR|nr:ABC transporter permease [Borrelia miyamotoi]AGT27622.1 sugar ABC transporter permease [Borrelia miyamotoi LB-2001]AJA58788.1 sugar ABC transporter permease [Borrelia miyamotoi]AOW95872.1 sugar ABC transporter permease [Borrelia miyamotoi]QTL83764.1 ABC transporter permease [Borrelia miyamotoi]WAZ84930.1 ABC transporter permease [Borrelia miyamotoi]
MLDALLFIISETLVNSQTLILAGLGGLISEKSGIINIGIEGTMTLGAFFGATCAYYYGSPLFAIFVGGLSGLVLSIFHAIFTIFFQSDQIITGMAINFLGPAIAMLFGSFIFGSVSTPPIDIKLPVFLEGVLDKKSLMFQIFGKRYSLHMAIMCVIFFHIVFKYTKIGLRIKASGEDPEVLESLGVNVIMIRFVCVLLSGLFAGMSGAVLSTVIASSYTQGIIGGQGFIAIVMLIFGNWQSFGILMGSFLFSFVRTLVVMISQISFFSLMISPKILIILPYVAVILSLMFFAKNNYAPKSLGCPYKKC